MSASGSGSGITIRGGVYPHDTPSIATPVQVRRCAEGEDGGVAVSTTSPQAWMSAASDPAGAEQMPITSASMLSAAVMCRRCVSVDVPTGH